MFVFSAIGRCIAGILDATGALKLPDALFVCGLLVACVAGLFALEGSDAPLAIRMRAAATFSLAGFADRDGLGIPVTRAQALAVVSALVAAAGLVAAGSLIGSL